MEKTRKKSSRKKKQEPAMPLWFKKLIIAVSAIFVLIVLGTAIFFINFFGSGGSNVVIEVDGPEEVLRGVPFEIDVSINNGTDSLVSNAELSLSLDEGIRNLGNLNGDRVFTDQIGDLGKGSLAKRTYRFLAVGGEEEEEIAFSLSYFSSRQNRFETKETWKVKIGGSAVKIDVQKPEQILPGSVFELDIQYENNSDFDLPEAVLEVKYPSSFRFSSASLNPDSLNNYWRLGELRSGSSGNLQVRGTIEGGDNSFTLPVVFGARFLGEDFPVVEEVIELTVSPSPVGLNLLVNRRSDYVARIGDRLTYTIRYENSSGIALTDVVISAELTGELYDFSTLSSNGNVSNGARTVTWDVSSVPALRLLDAGASGEVGLEIKLKDRFPISRLNDKDFSLRFKAELTSPSVPYYLSASETRAEASVETKVAGLTQVDAQAFYRDALSKIVNGGPMPPKVGEPTEYTIHWLVTNYATDISGVSVKAHLPQNVRWTGIVKSNTDTVPLYDEGTREIVWNIDKIRATQGVLDESLAAVFQIEASPVSSDLGNFQELVSATILKATDDFTGLELTSSDVAINSSLPDDVTIGQNGGRVVP
jgi:hypothetical protein